MACCSSCGCTNGSCGCNYKVIINNNGTGTVYTSANIGLIGVGVYDSQDGSEFDFRTIASATTALTVTLDSNNHAIILTLDIPSIIDDLPQATTTQRGVGETATDAEAIAKASIVTFVTPSNFAAMASSTTFAGLVELATNAETQAGASAVLAVTPAGLASTNALLKTMQTWNDAVARVAAVPDYDGQLGVQLDVNIPYVADGGQFNLPLLVLQNTSNVATVDNTIISLTNSANFIFTSPDSTGTVFIDINTSLEIDGFFNVAAGGRIQDDGVLVPANSVLTTSGTAGQFNSSLISTFLSNANVQTYGLPTSTLARTTFATYAGQAISNPPTQAEVQALDNAVVIVSQRLGALITDLMATLKPHA